MRISAIYCVASMAFVVFYERHLAAFNKHYSLHLPIFSPCRLHMIKGGNRS